jgi:hypothetical protein
MKDAKGHGSEKRGGASAVTASAYGGKPTWHGITSSGQKVTNQAGNKISYASPEAAVAGAHLTDQQAAAALAQGGAKSAPVPIHDGAAGRSDQPLAGMTQGKWDAMNPAQKNAVRDNGSLSPQLKGLEGHRVQVTDTPGSASRNFIVGKSTGWVPAHLEVKTSRSFGGGVANKSYASVRSLGKVR